MPGHRSGLLTLLLAALPGVVLAAAASAQTQPTLPQPVLAVTTPGSPLVEQIVGDKRAPLVARRQAARRVAAHHHVVRRIRVSPDLDRPALAGVELEAPLPLPGEPPHIVVQQPAYPLDSFVTAFTTPPPPIVCHRTHRDSDAPDPRLYREVPVVCEPDNP